jgi:hypothetical protein
MTTDIKSVVVEAKLDGASWTDITPDVVIGGGGISVVYGITGHGPLDRLAKSGTMTITLNNSATNSGALAGYYTPGHANARTGFELNLPIRLRLVAGDYYGVPIYGDGTFYGGNYVKFLGKVSAITVIPGSSRQRTVQVTAQDFIWEMSKHKMDLLSVQESRRSDLFFSDVVGNMTEAPESTTYATGQETFLFGGDDLKDEKSTALAAAQKAVVSEFGYAYVKGNISEGGELVFEDRHQRVNSDPIFTLDGTEVFIQPIQRGFDLVYNLVKATANPREVGAAAETLYTLQNAIEIGPGVTYTITARYKDPDQRATRISGKDIVTPVISTDYKFGSSEGVGIEDKNADLTVTITKGANSSEVSLENTSGSSGFVNLFRIRGTALRMYDPIQIEAVDATSQTAYGKRELSMNLPYQDSSLVAQDFADITLANYKNPQFFLNSVGVVGVQEGKLLAAALVLEPGSRITLSDELGGIDNDYFVHSVNFTILPNNTVKVFWSLVVASAGQSWLLGSAGFSELGDTTILGV